MSIFGELCADSFDDGYKTALNDLLNEMFGECMSESLLRDTYFSNLKWHQTIIKLRDEVK
jgi:hypothetical protein